MMEENLEIPLLRARRIEVSRGGMKGEEKTVSGTGGSHGKNFFSRLVVIFIDAPVGRVPWS
jgi:hypothetical protein